MKTKNSPPTSVWLPEDRCATCGSPCDVWEDIDELDYCNDCRPEGGAE